MSENSHAIYNEPLHSVKIDTWCAISQTQNIGPIFFDCTVNREVYLTIFDAFVNHSTDDLQTGYFQQEGERCYMSHKIMRET
jgi:hypothetical protein